MAGYVVTQIRNIKDQEIYKEYVSKVTPIVKKYGGEFTTVEGKWDYSRNVVIKFPSYEKALEWYNSPELKPVKQMRLSNSESNGIIIKGE